MNTFDELSRQVKEINVNETFEFLDNLNSSKSFVIKSKHKMIDGLNLTMKKGNRSFEFESDWLKVQKDMVKYQSIGYGFLEPFELVGNANLKIDAAEIVNFEIGHPGKCTGELWHIESDNFSDSNTYHRILIPLEYNPNYTHYSFIQSQPFKVGMNIRMAGLCQFKISNTSFQLFDYKKGEFNYIIIDSLDSISPEEFERKISCVVYVLGFITGSLARDEMYIVQSADKSFREFTGFQFRKIEESVLTGITVVDPDMFYQLTKRKDVKCHIPINAFSNLCEVSFNDHRFLRALKIITESNKYPLEIRASTYSVTLETLKNIILEENKEKINPIKKRVVARKLIKNIKEITEEIPDSEFNNKKSILNRIEQINQVPNADGFELAFTLLGIKLNETDKRCLKLRNDFLHGRIPFEDEKNQDPKQLQFFVYKLHFLVSSLILKYCGYSGIVKNHAKVFDVFHGKKNYPEAIFRSI